jgi:hypothetical protein
MLIADALGRGIMSLSFRRLLVLAGLELAAASSAWAGTPVVLLNANPTSAQFTSPGLTTPVTQTITLTFSDNGNPTFGAQLNALSFLGGNAADFAIVGGTCQPGTTVLSDTSTTCTIVVQYTPSTRGTENSSLVGTCTSVGLPGGLSFVCNGTSQTVSLLNGAVAAALAQLPTLGPRLMTLLATLLVGVGAWFATRKRA